jgi:glucosamine 6-phosphate synthetase-like amidotransferase/phosphosugar isomerase protein
MTLFDKTVSNMEEVMARNGKVLADPIAAGREAGDGTWKVLIMPAVMPIFAPILYAVPAQLAGLSHRHRQGHGRRPAAQPCQIRDG